MRILAVSDVHSPRYYDDFTMSLERVDPPHLFLMAGDMINRGNADEFPKLVELITDILGNDFPIVACFGNEEYAEARKEILSTSGDRVTFLDEKSLIVKVDGLNVGIVGTQGSLDKPTNWQKRMIPNIRRVYEQRADRAASLLRDLKGKVDRRILLMHYSPCLETCEGEDRKHFAWLGSRKFYTVVMDTQPDLVIHGHVHGSVRHEATLGRTLVRNVSIPAVGSISELNLWS